MNEPGCVPIKLHYKIGSEQDLAHWDHIRVLIPQNSDDTMTNCYKTSRAQMLRLWKSKAGRKEKLLTTLRKISPSREEKVKMSLNCYESNTKLEDKQFPK